jgi:hypothetical protein
VHGLHETIPAIGFSFWRGQLATRRAPARAAGIAD